MPAAHALLRGDTSVFTAKQRGSLCPCMHPPALPASWASQCCSRLSSRLMQVQTTWLPACFLVTVFSTAIFLPFFIFHFNKIAALYPALIGTRIFPNVHSLTTLTLRHSLQDLQLLFPFPPVGFFDFLFCFLSPFPKAILNVK